MDNVRLAFIGIATLFLSGCATTDTMSSMGSNVSSSITSLFNQRGSALSALIESKKFREADDYFAKERSYFLENKKENIPTLEKLQVGLAAIWDPEIEAAIARITVSKTARPENWGEAKDSLAAGNKTYAEVSKVEIFKEPSFKLKSAVALKAALSGIEAEWEKTSQDAFKKYDHLAGESFFANYPVELDASFLDSNFSLTSELVGSFTAAQLSLFASIYSTQISKSDLMTSLMTNKYLEKYLENAPKPVSLVSIIDAVKRTKAAGFNPKNVPGIKIGFAEVTSQTLLKEGHIEFPAQVTMDLPFEPTKAEIDDLLEGQDKSYPDFLIVFDVAKATTSRRILTKTDAESKFVSGSKTEPNPAYEVARGKLYEAQVGLARAQGTYSPSIAAAIVNGIAVGLWSNNVKNAETALYNTPPSVTSDLTSDYKYSTSEVKANRVMSTNYYIIDRVTKKYYKGIFDTTESKTFKISYNLHDKDTRRHQILGQYDKEDDIVRFEQEPMAVTASAIVEDYLKNAISAKPLPAIAKLRQEMLEDKNKALASHKAKQFDGKPLKDSRFDSVVVILNPKGMLGSGFFVKPTMVLTNYHVVEGVKFVEMKMYNGMETFGKVVKSDVRLDLALIKVQDQGVPVQFFEGNTIDLGTTLEAIGHPKGLTFTITRGVASAVRKKKSVYAVGGKDVMFVQTDAAINPGNSGGPLFLGQQVVGVNNNKLVSGSEGLGFAVHYSEVAEFMKESF